MKLNIVQVSYYFVKVIKDAITRSHNILNDIIWLQECTIIVFNIFWKIGLLHIQ